MKEYIISWEKSELVLDDDRVVTIGRNPGSDIYYADKRLSREHAHITLENGVLTLEDLGSSNGTLLNNKLISSKEVLKDRDRVVTGPLHLTILVRETGDKKEEKKTFKCPSCDFGVSAEAKFCPQCGESLEDHVSVRTCRKCNTELSPGALFCPQCGDSIKEIILDKDDKSDKKAADADLDPSGLGPRLIAGVIDSLIVLILLVTLVVAPALVGHILFSDIEADEGFSLSNGAVLVPGAGGFILFLFIFSVLYGYFWGVKGKSPGMALTGVQVLSTAGNSLGFGKGLLRALVSLFIPGWLLVFITPKRQGLHDMVAGSVVVS